MTEDKGKVQIDARSRIGIWWRQVQLPILVLLVLGTLIWLQMQTWQREQVASQQQQRASEQISLDQQKEGLLTNYISTISDLLAHDKLLQAQNGDAAKNVAQARTIEVLHGLDGGRKAAVLRFLNETNLINNDYHSISLANVDVQHADLRKIDLKDTAITGCLLNGSDLRGANLSYATLTFVDFSGVNLAEANLYGSDMHNVDLTGANLAGANLQSVVGLSNDQLGKVKSLAGATMPDGSKHA